MNINLFTLVVSLIAISATADNPESANDKAIGDFHHSLENDYFYKIAKNIEWGIDIAHKKISSNKSNLIITVAGRPRTVADESKFLIFDVDLDSNKKLTLKSVEVFEMLYNSFLYRWSIDFLSVWFGEKISNGSKKITEKKILDVFEPLCFLLLKKQTVTDLNDDINFDRYEISATNLMKISYVITTLRLRMKNNKAKPEPHDFSGIVNVVDQANNNSGVNPKTVADKNQTASSNETVGKNEVTAALIDFAYNNYENMPNKFIDNFDIDTSMKIAKDEIGGDSKIKKLFKKTDPRKEELKQFTFDISGMDVIVNDIVKINNFIALYISNKNAKFDDNIIEYNQKEKKPFPVTFGQISEKEVYLRKFDTYFAEKKNKV